jgi:hypothetical protein
MAALWPYRWSFNFIMCLHVSCSEVIIIFKFYGFYFWASRVYVETNPKIYASKILVYFYIKILNDVEFILKYEMGS